MACISPRQLDDTQLLAYLDRDAGADVVDHIGRCAHCRARAQELARLQGRLSAGLYRATCPSSLELGEYHLGLLPSTRAESVAQHLAGCPHCTRELSDLHGYLGALTPDVQFRVGERVRVRIAELVRQVDRLLPAGGSALAPAYAGVRGGEAAPRLYAAGEAQVALDLQPDARAPGLVLLLGLVIGLDPAGMQVHLWRGGKPAATADVDDLGNFSLSGLAPGAYDLILAGPDAEIHVQELQVG